MTSTTIYSIYKATNIINNKVYIGYSKHGLGRKYQHLEKSVNSNLPFHNAIQKYGNDAFIWEIIYQSQDGDHTLNEMEPYFIKEYRSFVDFTDSNGYNATLGGKQSSNHSTATKKLLSKYTKKQWENEDYRNKMISYNKTKWSNPKYIENRINGWEVEDPKGMKTVVSNLAEFCRNNNLDDGCMTAVAKGKRKHHKGYKCTRIKLK